MIVTVTMNPAIDKTIELDTFVRGGLNRARSVERDAGGKGVNVSKTLKALGKNSTATGFLAGVNGGYIEKFLKESGITCDFLYVEGEVRTNTKIYEKNGGLTELNEAGPPIPAEKIAELLEKLDAYADPKTLFVLSGSAPASVERDIYARIIRRVKKKGAKVLLDADGELFAGAAREGPDIIKPNREELKEFLHIIEGQEKKTDLAEQEIQRALKLFEDHGIRRVALSLGREGARFYFPGYRAKCPALPVKVCSEVGAGDAIVAALAYAWEEELDPEETVRLCMAASAAAVTMPGSRPPDKTYVEKLKKDVEIIQKTDGFDFGE